MAAISGLSITPEISEGETVTLSGQLSGNGPLSLTVDWGDDNDPQTFAYPAGTTSFSQTHQYTVSPSDGSPYEVDLSLCDAVGMWDEQEVSTQVTHVAPTLGSVAVTGATYVGDTGTLTGTISEPNPLYNYTLQVGWGDGSTETYTLPTGATTFSESYQFQGKVCTCRRYAHGRPWRHGHGRLARLDQLSTPFAEQPSTSFGRGRGHVHAFGQHRQCGNLRQPERRSRLGRRQRPADDRLRGREHVLSGAAPVPRHFSVRRL